MYKAILHNEPEADRVIESADTLLQLMSKLAITHQQAMSDKLKAIGGDFNQPTAWLEISWSDTPELTSPLQDNRDYPYCPKG